ncbi:MAG: arginine decarboxylase, partial [Planctomycetales bacterium]|nr:arginine decarboxylase [Planctomycetales bacterium]
NLFGDTNVANVRIAENGSVEFLHELQGDCIADVLGYVEYQPEEMSRRLRATAEAAVQEGVISVAERQELLRLYNESMRGYTYYEE